MRTNKKAEQKAAKAAAKAAIVAHEIANYTNIDLTSYDVLLVSSSGGKDSLAMLDEVVTAADAQGVRDRIQVVHADLGRVEWAGTKELVEKQCELYGLPLEVVRREQDLLAHVEEHGMWPGSDTRFCTSDHKRDQIAKLITSLVDAHIVRLGGDPSKRNQGHVRVLNIMGLRAQESSKRSEKPMFENNGRISNTKRTVDNWLPIKHWSEDQVWARIKGKSLPYHYAYDLGMPRLSCVFCIFAPEPALLLAGHHNRPLLDQYVAVEQKIGHTFKSDLALVTIQAKLDAGYVPAKVDGSLWSQCA